MQLDYPRPLTGDRDRDIQDLWEALWRLIEALNVEDQRRGEEATGR